nr:hypothetical protein [uncultured Eisenbergiella sp.]
MVMLDRGWGYLCDKSKPERKEALYQYAVNYVEPVLENYPELKGKVYLALRKHGFFAEYDPEYRTVRNRTDGIFLPGKT